MIFRTFLIAAILVIIGSATGDWGEAVYEITPADETEKILDEEAMIFVLYQDKSHQDNDKYIKIFKELAEEHAQDGVSPL